MSTPHQADRRIARPYNQTRSTPARLVAALVGAGLIVVAISGCSVQSDRQWAQTADSIEPTPPIQHDEASSSAHLSSASHSAPASQIQQQAEHVRLTGRPSDSSAQPSGTSSNQPVQTPSRPASGW